MPRPDLHSATIYFSSREERLAWRDAAAAADKSLSSYLLEMAEKGRDG